MALSLEVFKKTLSVASALLVGEDVGEEQMKKRLEICRNCEKAVLKGNLMRCGICGCRLSEHGLMNLIRFVEAKRYGCLYKTGSRWKAAGC